MIEFNIEKVNEVINVILLKRYNPFYAGLISRAIQDSSMPMDVFRKGLSEIEDAYATGNNDVIPKGWEGV